MKKFDTTEHSKKTKEDELIKAEKAIFAKEITIKEDTKSYPAKVPAQRLEANKDKSTTNLTPSPKPPKATIAKKPEPNPKAKLVKPPAKVTQKK